MKDEKDIMIEELMDAVQKLEEIISNEEIMSEKEQILSDLEAISYDIRSCDSAIDGLIAKLRPKKSEKKKETDVDVLILNAKKLICSVMDRLSEMKRANRHQSSEQSTAAPPEKQQ